MSDETAHYMESTSRLRAQLEASQIIAQANENTMNIWEAEAKRLRAENEELRDFLKDSKVQTRYWHEQWEIARSTMREVAEELRHSRSGETLRDLADRLDPPPVVEKPLHAYFPSDVNAGSRSPCVHCGQAYDAHVPPPVVENPPA